MENNIHKPTKTEIELEKTRVRIQTIMNITGRPYSNEARDIENVCRAIEIDLNDIESVKKVAQRVIEIRNMGGMLPSGQPCI